MVEVQATAERQAFDEAQFAKDDGLCASGRAVADCETARSAERVDVEAVS